MIANKTESYRNKAHRAIAFALILTFAASLITCLPAAVVFGAIGTLPSGASEEIPAQTWAFLYFRPNPIGLGQELLINGWTSPPPHRYEDLNMTPRTSNGTPPKV